MTIKIEKGIPMPEPSPARGFRTLLESMSVGDSFLAPPWLKDGSLRVTAKRAGMRVSTRKTEEGWRIWIIGKDGAE